MTTGTGPDAVVLAPSLQKVFVANSGSSLTAFSTTTCNQSTTSGCSSPTQVSSSGHLSSPSALAVNGSTLYVGNGNGSVAVYNASGSTPTWTATVTLPSGSVPTALAVDPTNGFVYVADGSQQPARVLQRDDVQRDHDHHVLVHAEHRLGRKGPRRPGGRERRRRPLRRQRGNGGGISVVSLSTHAVVKTISTSSSRTLQRDRCGPIHRSVAG